jgi:hypothetical protein
MTIWKNQLSSQEIEIDEVIIKDILSKPFIQIEKGNTTYKLGLTQKHTVAILAETTTK